MTLPETYVQGQLGHLADHTEIAGQLAGIPATYATAAELTAHAAAGDPHAAYLTEVAAAAAYALSSDFRVQADGSGGARGPNVILGHSTNAVASDLGSTSISGGGQTNYNNIIGGDGSATVDTVTPNAAQTGTAAHYSAIFGGYDNVAGGLASMIGGFHNYTALGTTHGTILGGSKHKITAGDYGTICGGTQNIVSGTSASVLGGSLNTASGSTSSVAGGTGNTASGISSFSAGQANTSSGIAASTLGRDNQATKDYSSVLGGRTNIINGAGTYAAIAGGQTNTASGAHSAIVGGLSNTASNTATVVGGQTNTASGLCSTAFGRDNLASGDYSTVLGRDAKTTTVGQIAKASGKFSAQGDAQVSSFTLRALTTDATTATAGTNANLNGAAWQMQADCSTVFTILVVARDTSTGDTKAWRIDGAAKNNTAAAAAFLGSPAATEIGTADAAAATWAVALLAGTDSISLRVTGEAGKTIAWVADMQAVEAVG